MTRSSNIVCLGMSLGGASLISAKPADIQNSRPLQTKQGCGKSSAETAPQAQRVTEPLNKAAPRETLEVLMVVSD